MASKYQLKDSSLYILGTDVHTYSKKVWQFNQNVLSMLDIFEKKLHENKK